MKRFMAAVLSLVLAVGVIVVPAYGEEYATYGEFQYRNDGDHITILGYTSTEPDIVFPDFIDGLPVTVIAGMTFTPEHPETETIYLPATVTDYSFSNLGLPNLKGIYVDQENTIYKDIDGVLFSKDGKSLIQFPAVYAESYSIPQGTETIDQGSFSCSSLRSLYMPDSVLSIELDAMKSCALERIRFSLNLLSIENMAFQNCSNLKSLQLPPSLKTIHDEAFANCASLVYVDIPGDTVLYAYAFAECSNLQEVIMTGQVSIGYLCFQHVPLSCNFYTLPQIEINDWSFKEFTNRIVLGLDAKTNVGVGVLEEQENLLVSFSATRQVKELAGKARNLLAINNIDPRLLSNIYNISFDSKSSPELLIFPVSSAASKPQIYFMDDNGNLTETNINWVGNWAILKEVKGGVCLVLQQGAAMGDLDGDGDMDISDVMALCRVIARESAGAAITDTERQRGDLDGDSTVDIADVMSVCRLMAGHLA